MTANAMGPAFPKVGARRRTKAQVDAALDRAESALVRERSDGRCEVVELPHAGDRFGGRCRCWAVHVLHLIGGRGKRGRGISALAAHKLHACARHHREIDGDLGGKRLQRIGGPIPVWTDPYLRVGRRQETA